MVEMGGMDVWFAVKQPEFAVDPLNPSDFASILTDFEVYFTHLTDRD